MKPLAWTTVLTLLALVATGADSLQDMAPPARLDQHAWLQQLVGEWNVTMEATMEPGAEPMRMESTESARSLGGLWIVAEGSASMGGVPMTSIMTLGYDPERTVFVGTWIDTMQTHLWTYVGQLDASHTKLTLSTEGPSFGDASDLRQYRDAIEIKGPDHKQLTSSIQNEDGSWTTFMQADYHRKN